MFLWRKGVFFADNRQTIFTLENHGLADGLPDGQTIDSDGNLWVAIFGSKKVIKIDPRRPETLLDTIELPADEVTSVAFGGANLDELYVTTGRLPFRNKDFSGPEHGALYKITGTGSRGLPPNNVKLPQ